MKKLMVTLLAVSLVAPVLAQAKMTTKAAKAACKSEMPGATKKELKACIKGKKHS